MKKTYLTPTAEKVTITRMLMQGGSLRVTNAATNLTGEDNIVIGGPGSGIGARSDIFSGSVWDDTDYEE